MGNSTILFAEAHKTTRPRAFSTLVKAVGSSCNMRCDYCYYLDKASLYDNNQDQMSDELLKLYIRQYIEANQTEIITFCWHGGEPLLAGQRFYERAMRYQSKYANGKKIENTIQTNGLLLDANWCRFFKANNFLVGVSIDGPEDIHNAYRKNRGGKPTFVRVMRAIELLKQYSVEFNTLSVVNNLCHSRGREIYNFFKSIDSQFMQFLPAVEYVSMQEIQLLGGRGAILSPYCSAEGQLSPWSVGSLEYGVFMADIFDEWIKKDVGRYYVQMFDATLAAWYGMEPSLCSFSRNCGDALAVEHNGDVYSCDHFVYPENLLGNIQDTTLGEMYSSTQQFDFGLSKRTTLTKKCLQCNYNFVCSGGCPKHRFAEGENYLCSGFKHFFEHVKPSMEIMVNLLQNGKSPTLIMK